MLFSKFHANILAVICGQPCDIRVQISGKSEKTLDLAVCYAVLIGRSDTGNHKGFVDIHPAVGVVNDLGHNTSLRNIIWGADRDWTFTAILK